MTETPEVRSVRATFFTTTHWEAVPETTYTIPLNSLPEGLSTFVNTILGHEEAGQIPFDFLINDEYLVTSLEKFIRRRKLSSEDILNVEYTPSIQAKEGSKLPHDDWIASIRAPYVGVPGVLLTGSYDHCVRLWNGESCLAMGTGHQEAVKEVDVLRTSEISRPKVGKKRQERQELGSLRVLSACKDGSVFAWNFDGDAFHKAGEVREHVGSVESVSFDPTGRLFCSGSCDKSVKVWEAGAVFGGREVTPLWSLTDHARAVLCCRFGSEGVLYSTGLDGCVKVWDVEKGQLVSTLPGDHAAYGLAGKPGAGTDMIVTCHTDNRIRLHDPRTRSVALTWSGHYQWVYSVAWCHRDDDPGPSTGLLASASEDATVRLWDSRSPKHAVLTLDRLHTDGVLDVCYVGSHQIASGGKDNKTKTFAIKQAK